MIQAESMRTAEPVPVEQYATFVETAHRHDFLVCPSCGWEVRYYAAGGGNMAHFRHLGLSGDLLYKRCPNYRSGRNSGLGGGVYQPTLGVDDRHTLNEVLQGYVIHLLAKESGFFGAKGRSYGDARDNRSHLWLMGEVKWADAIAGAVKSSGLSERWTVCTAAFLRFALGSASDDAAGEVHPKLTPFRQILAIAWSSVQEGMQSELRDILSKAGLQGAPEVPREQVAVLRSWLFFMQGYEGYQPSLGQLPPRLDKAVHEALAAAPIEPGERRPKRLIAAMVIHTLLRIVEGLRIDRLIDDPASLMPAGGFIYIAVVYQGAEPVGVKVGRTKNFPRREKQHRLASAGSVREFDFVRFVSDDVAAERKLKAAMARRFSRLKDAKGLTLGNERFACSIGEAKFVARHVLRDFETRIQGRSEAVLAIG